jgi:hypothetical protein
MQCRLCNIKLAPLRSLTDGEFCCDEHRQSFYEEQARIDAVVSTPARSALIPLPGLSGLAGPKTPVLAAATEPAAFQLEVTVPSGFSTGAPTVEPNAGLGRAGQMLPLYFEQTPSMLRAGERALPSERPFGSAPRLPQIDALSVPRPSLGLTEEEAASAGNDLRHPAGKIAKSWYWVRDAWQTAPLDLRMATVLLPILLAVAVSGSVPKVTIPKAASGAVQHLMADPWKNLHQTISNRAAVAFADDFRSGLDAWDSHSNLTTSWSYDAAGFVLPGPLAVFKPTIDLSDYRFEFLGEIDQKGLGWAFRAADLKNYYAVKFVVVKPGPLPLVHLVRYAVIDGKEGPRVEKPLPISVRSDMLYRVLLDVRGADFTIMAQGQVVDFWSDSRLRHGGVGFFCGHGEKARVRWVEVSHQYDTLGRLCAYLAPLGIEGRNGNFN